ncbi:aldehyde dehydrogenase family protein [Flammeovirga aprica JL-4]|uniref:Aldehyde dehydrogenase family protein n=2 Tax=Flammeovirga aprica TaxID=29528 RepID=A0A7X9RYY3_9BACT|nr:aldehyde dehydrogenase family protein [Flammeovirga aprica JL-4]
MNIYNPSNEQLLKSIQEDSAQSLQDKLHQLRQGQIQWEQKAVADRLECILKFGELVQENIDDLARILTSETGKPIQQSYNEIRGAHNRVEHLKNNAEKWLADNVIEGLEGTYEKIMHEPLGVVANISAWNFPYNVGYNVFLYALVAGNSVAYKPSEFAALTGLAITDLLYKAGIPKDVFQCIVGDGTIGQAMLEADFEGYFFTGSYPTGLHILKEVSPKMVPVQLELGGKDPLYIMDDVKEVKVAAINAAEGAFYNNGQSCCAVERIYVHEKIYNEFVEYFLEEVEGYVIGDPVSEKTFIGSLTRKGQLNLLRNQVNDATSKGAKLLLGGDELAGKGNFFAPTILTEVNHEMLVMKEESFGPIIGIQKVNNDEEAIALMKDTEYGLTAAVFATAQQRAEKVLKAMNTGTVYWNCCDRVSPNVPWSGRNKSGVGATLSSQGIRAFTQPKAYHWREV